MGSVNRHYIPGQIWHLTHRCHKKEHPSQWQWCGYNEIQKPRRRNLIIDYQKLIELSGFKSYYEFQSAHKSWIEHSLTIDQ